MDRNPYSDKLEDAKGSPFVGEKIEPHGIGGQRGNDPNADAIEQHQNADLRHSNDAPPLNPIPDPMQDGT